MFQGQKPPSVAATKAGHPYQSQQRLAEMACWADETRRRSRHDRVSAWISAVLWLLVIGTIAYVVWQGWSLLVAAMRDVARFWGIV